MKKGIIAAIAIAGVLIVSGIALCAVSVDMGAQPKELFSNGTFSLDFDDFELEFSDHGAAIRGNRNNNGNISSWPGAEGKTEIYAENLVISWTSGSVSIVGTDVDRLSFSESADGGIDSDEAMSYTVEGNTLYIDYCKDGFYFGIGDSMPAKDLVVTVPLGFGEIVVETVSADAEIRTLDLNRSLRIDTTSGAVNVSSVSAGSVELESVSGNIFFSGRAAEFDADTTSGKVEAAFDAMPKGFEADTVSGDVYLSLAEGSDFEIEFDTVSGRLSSEIEMRMDGDEYIAGRGGPEINVSTVSGDCIIKKK